MGKSITVLEFDKISVQTFAQKFDNITAKTAFKQLKKFILPTQETSEEDEPFNEYGELKDASVCMSLGIENREEIIRVKNYVGTISLPCGVTIEVLPKIAGSSSEEARKLVIEMLKVCSEIFYKTFQNASLAVGNLPLFEVYISLFLNELKILCKKGLRAGYVNFEGNENFMRGKLKFGEQIKFNFAHKERFYVQYDLFSFNRAENRLIKATLKYLLLRSLDDNNRRDLRKYLLLFDEITVSENIQGDFDKCETGRAVKDYENILKLCRVFLRKKSFTMYSGTSDVIALMFPMETLFERYIAKEMEKAINNKWRLYPQSTGKYLYDKKCFLLRPDILLENTDKGEEDDKGNKQKIIVDTKWKKLKPKEKNFGISQADMYQMYAYHTRLTNVKEVVLLYPYYEEIKDLKDLQYDITEMNIHIYIAFFDLREYQSGKKFKDCIKGITYNSVNTLNQKSELLAVMGVKNNE